MIAVNHLYMLFRHVIGLWFCTDHSPSFGIRTVLPRSYYLYLHVREMKHLGYVDRVSGYIPCRTGVVYLTRNRELVVPVPDEDHLWQPSYSVHASVEILFIYFTSLCLSLV